jgi:hypothetical protein
MDEQGGEKMGRYLYLVIHGWQKGLFSKFQTKASEGNLHKQDLSPLWSEEP